jgi:hypothetical protein
VILLATFLTLGKQMSFLVFQFVISFNLVWYLLVGFLFTFYYFYINCPQLQKQIKNAIKYLRVLKFHHIDEPEIGSHSYFFMNSKKLETLRGITFCTVGYIIMFIFFIYRFVKEHESLVLMIIIIVICSLLFYICCW